MTYIRNWKLFSEQTLNTAKNLASNRLLPQSLSRFKILGDHRTQLSARCAFTTKKLQSSLEAIIQVSTCVRC